ncbi:MAG: hypothetical protein ACXVEE_24875 [Polyangiales bacterium]
MARRLVVFGNVAVGPIAIGNVAVGYVAIGFTLAVGPIAISMNALGFLLAIGMNAIGLVDLAAINGMGAITFAGVNALGAFSFGNVNNGQSPVVAAVLGAIEATAATLIKLDETNRPRKLEDGDLGARVLLEDVNEDGVKLAQGLVLPWSQEVPPDARRLLQQQLRDARHPLFDIRLEMTDRALDEHRYREAPHVAHQRVLTSARLVEIERFYLPVFRRTLFVGAVLAFAVMVVAFLLH